MPAQHFRITNSFTHGNAKTLYVTFNKSISMLVIFIGLMALSCFGQKKKLFAGKNPELLSIDSSGKFIGKKRWNHFIKTDILLLNFWYKNDNVIMERKLNLVGYVAIQNDGKETSLKTGRWQTVVPGSPGLRLSEGDYSIGAFTKCCEAGYCTGYYNYKSGYWKFYFTDGKIRACGTFNDSTVEINTGCGNQFIKKNKLGTDWKFFSNTGQEITPDAAAIAEIEEFDEFR